MMKKSSTTTKHTTDSQREVNKVMGSRKPMTATSKRSTTSSTTTGKRPATNTSKQGKS